MRPRGHRLPRPSHGRARGASLRSAPVAPSSDSRAGSRERSYELGGSRGYRFHPPIGCGVLAVGPCLHRPKEQYQPLRQPDRVAASAAPHGPAPCWCPPAARFRRPARNESAPLGDSRLHSCPQVIGKHCRQEKEQNSWDDEKMSSLLGGDVELLQAKGGKREVDERLDDLRPANERQDEGGVRRPRASCTGSAPWCWARDPRELARRAGSADYAPGGW